MKSVSHHSLKHSNFKKICISLINLLVGQVFIFMNFNTEKIIQHFQKLILKNKEAYKSHFTQIQDHFLSTFIEIIIF